MADLASKLGEEVTCAICHEYYRTPKVLGCMHRFCRNCLHAYIVKQARDNGVRCPECRQVTRAPLPRPRTGRILPVTEWADQYPTDFLVQKMVDSLKKEKTSDDCTTHSGNPIVLFCQDCQTLICHVCAGVDHRKCDSVVSLRSEADKEKARLQRQLEALENAKKVSEENGNDITEDMDDLNKNYDSAFRRLKVEFENIRKLVTTQERTATILMRKGMFAVTADLTGETLTEQYYQQRIANAESKINRCIKTKSDAELIRTKLVVEVPDVKKREKRAVTTCDELYATVSKRLKLEETKEHLTIKLSSDL